MRYILSLVLLFVASVSWSQSTELSDFNQRRLHKQQTAMLVLGAWAVGNMGTGLALRGQAEGQTRHFHDMNIGWNAVNLTLAGFGYWASMKADPSNYDLAATIHEQYQVQKIFLLNTGLDVGYILGGAYLIERSKNTNKQPERMKGFGKSIMLQGGFLMLFDLAAYLAHAKGNSTIPVLLNSLQINGQGIGLNWTF